MADRHVTCSYKTCQDKAALDARVEVKTVLPRSKLQKKVRRNKKIPVFRIT